jgi:predicted metallopeptidase
MEVEKASDVQDRVEQVIRVLEFNHIIDARIICMRSRKAKARAYARIWSLPMIWRSALEISPFYVIEVLSEHYDKLDDVEKTKTIIHELMHIPKKFSGGLVPHVNKGRPVNHKEVDKLYSIYLEKIESNHQDL